MGQYLRPFIIFLLLLFIAVACDGTNGNNTTTRTIGPEGGTIRSSDGRLTLIIPAGALTEDTEITIRKINPEDLGPDFGGIFPDFAYQLEPDGLEFGETVTASLELEDEPTNGDGDFVSDVVVLLSLSGETLEFLENQEQILDGDNNTNTISAELTHFSELLSFTFDGFKFSVEGVPDSLPPNSDFTAVLKVSFTEEVSPFISGTEMNFRDQSKSPVMPSSFFFPSAGVCLPTRGEEDEYPLNYNCSEGVGEFAGTIIIDIDELFPFTIGFFVNRDTRKKVHKTVSCVDKTTPSPSPPPPPMPPPPPTVTIADVDGNWLIDCISEQDPFAIIAGNLGIPVVLDVIIDVNAMTGEVTITTTDGLFTLMGMIVDQQNGIFVINAEGSGMLGDMSPNAANIVIKAENWNFVVNEIGEIVFTDGQLRFNFPELPQNANSSEASCFGDKVEE